MAKKKTRLFRVDKGWETTQLLWGLIIINHEIRIPSLNNPVWLMRKGLRRRFFCGFRGGKTWRETWEIHVPHVSNRRNTSTHSRIFQLATVDGSEIRRSTSWGWQFILLFIVGFLVYIPGGCLGFLNHQQYVRKYQRGIFGGWDPVFVVNNHGYIYIYIVQ